MYRWLPALALLACGCSSESSPLDPTEPDASTGDGGGNTSDTSSTDTSPTSDTSSTDTSPTSDTSSTDTSSTDTSSTDTSDTSSTTETDLDAGPDADTDTDADAQACEPLGQATCDGFDCDDYSSMDYEAALDALRLRCDDNPYQRAYSGEGCGYRILKHAFGAGDTFMAFYDASSHEVVGWRYASDTDPVAGCAGEVPDTCFEYGFTAPPNGEALCLDAGAPEPDAEAPDAEAPDAEAPDAEAPDATVVDAAADASDAAL